MNSPENTKIKKDLILTDSYGNKLNFNSLCISLKKSKLSMADIKELSDVILKSLNKMPYNEKILKNNTNHNKPKDLTANESKIPNNQNINYNSGSSFLSNETFSKSHLKGYDADISKSMNNNENDKLKKDFKSNLIGNYFQRNFNPNYHRLSNFISQQNISNSYEHTNTNKTSSSGVYSESPPDNSDNDSDLELVTRIIDESFNIDNDYIDSDTDTQIDDFYEYANSTCESEYHGFDALTNANQSNNYSNISGSSSDILNRSATAWLSQCRNGCECSKCYINRLIRKAEISCLNEQNGSSSSSSQVHQHDKPLVLNRSSTPFHRTKKTYLDEILSDSSRFLENSISSTSSSIIHCTGNDMCLICKQNSIQEQSIRKSFQL